MIRKIAGTMKLNRRSGMVAMLLLLSVVLAACGGGGSSGGGGSKQAATAADAPGVVVRMSNYSYVPKEIRAKVGEKITFINEDHLAHDVIQTTPGEVISGPRGFESPQIMPDSQWTTSFDKVGTYPILCTVEAHYLLGMTAEIIITE